MASAESFVVKVVCAWPDRSYATQVQLREPTTVDRVVRSSGILERFPELASTALTFGVFGRVVPADYVVRAGDRIEVLRPLAHDPKETRRKLAAEGRSMGGRKLAQDSD